MAKKKSGGGHKPRGHFCKVCGEHKANEKFSGKGHAAHICKKCAALPVAERNEMMAMRRIEGMAFRYLNEGEIKWLRSRMNDSRPAVRDAARETHVMKFPRQERNMAKKGLTAFSLELFIHGGVWDEYGDEVPVHARVFAEDTGLFRLVDYAAPEGKRETGVSVEPKEARRFLKAAVHELDLPFLDGDYSDAEYDPYLDVLPEFRPAFDEEDEDGDDREEPGAAPPESREPLWSLHMELNDGSHKDMVFYNRMPDAIPDLFRSLMEYFELDEDGVSDLL
jgi:hypothetical protein